MASPYQAGDEVLYFSRMSQDWVPTQVSNVSPTGDVELSHKRGLWMSPKEQPMLLRPAKGMAMQAKGNQLNQAAVAAPVPPPQCQGPPPNMKGGHPHAGPPAAGGGWQMARPMPPVGKGGAGGMWPGGAPLGKGADPWHAAGKGAGAAGPMPPPDPNKGAWPRPPPAGKGAPPPGGYGAPQPQPSPRQQHQQPPPAAGHQGAHVPAPVAAVTTDPGGAGRAPIAEAMPTACAFAGCEHAAATTAPPSPPVYQQPAAPQQQALPTACAFPGGSGSGRVQGGLPAQAAAMPTGCAFPAGTLAGGLVVRDPDVESYPGELQQLKQNQWKTMDATEFQQNQKRIKELERRAV